MSTNSSRASSRQRRTSLSWALDEDNKNNNNSNNNSFASSNSSSFSSSGSASELPQLRGAPTSLTFGNNNNNFFNNDENNNSSNENVLEPAGRAKLNNTSAKPSPSSTPIPNAASVMLTKKLLEERLETTKMTKRLKSARRAFRLRMESSERNQMMCEDHFANMSMRNVKYIDDVTQYDSPKKSIFGIKPSSSSSSSSSCSSGQNSAASSRRGSVSNSENETHGNSVMSVSDYHAYHHRHKHHHLRLKPTGGSVVFSGIRRFGFATAALQTIAEKEQSEHARTLLKIRNDQKIPQSLRQDTQVLAFKSSLPQVSSLLREFHERSVEFASNFKKMSETAADNLCFIFEENSHAVHNAYQHHHHHHHNHNSLHQQQQQLSSSSFFSSAAASGSSSSFNNNNSSSSSSSSSRPGGILRDPKDDFLKELLYTSEQSNSLLFRHIEELNDFIHQALIVTQKEVYSAARENNNKNEENNNNNNNDVESTPSKVAKKPLYSMAAATHGFDHRIAPTCRSIGIQFGNNREEELKEELESVRAAFRNLSRESVQREKEKDVQIETLKEENEKLNARVLNLRDSLKFEKEYKANNNNNSNNNTKKQQQQQQQQQTVHRDCSPDVKDTTGTFSQLPYFAPSSSGDNFVQEYEEEEQREQEEDTSSPQRNNFSQEAEVSAPQTPPQSEEGKLGGAIKKRPSFVGSTVSSNESSLNNNTVSSSSSSTTTTTTTTTATAKSSNITVMNSYRFPASQSSSSSSSSSSDNNNNNNHNVEFDNNQSSSSSSTSTTVSAPSKPKSASTTRRKSSSGCATPVAHDLYNNANHNNKMAHTPGVIPTFERENQQQKSNKNSNSKNQTSTTTSNSARGSGIGLIGNSKVNNNAAPTSGRKNSLQQQQSQQQVQQQQQQQQQQVVNVSSSLRRMEEHAANQHVLWERRRSELSKQTSWDGMLRLTPAQQQQQQQMIAASSNNNNTARRLNAAAGSETENAVPSSSSSSSFAAYQQEKLQQLRSQPNQQEHQMGTSTLKMQTHQPNFTNNNSNNNSSSGNNGEAFSLMNSTNPVFAAKRR